MAANWEANRDEMLGAIEEESRRSAERRAALTPRRRFRAEIAHAAEARNLRRGTRGHAATRAANRATSAARRRIMANYISRNPNFRSLGALRATAKKPLLKQLPEKQLPENIISHIGSMLYGPRAKGQGHILEEMARKGRAHRVAAATRRHFPNLGLPKPTRRRSAPPKTRRARRSRSRSRSHSK